MAMFVKCNVFIAWLHPVNGQVTLLRLYLLLKLNNTSVHEQNKLK